MKLFRNTGLIEKKFYTMLFGGVLSSLVISLVLISDTVVAGLMLGDEAVTAIGLFSPIYSFAASLGLIFSLGTPILYYKAIGSFEQKKANRVFGLGLISTLALGLLLFLFTLFAGNGYLDSYQAPPEISEGAKEYLYWMRYVILLLPLTSFISGMVFADGDEKLSVLSDVVSSAVNIALSILLAHGLGISGIAIASLCAAVINLAICGLHFFKKRNNLRPALYFSLPMLLSVVRFSIVDAAGMLTLSVFLDAMNHYVGYRFGPDMIIMVSVITVITETVFLFDGVGKAMTPALSLFLSEKCYCGVEKIWKTAKQAAVVLGIAVAVIMFLIAPLITLVFDFDDPAAAVFAENGIRIMTLGFPFTSLLYLLTTYYILREKIKPAFFITACYQCLLLIPLTVLLAEIWGIPGLYIGSAAVPAITWFGCRLLTCRRLGKEAWPLLLTEEMRNSRSWSYEMTVLPEQINSTMSEIQETLGKAGIDDKSIRHIVLLFEEVTMDIHDRNKGKNVRSECDIIITKDAIQLIEMDDGDLFNLTDDIDEPHTWREYVLSQLTSGWVDQSDYVKAVSFNRNIFRISRDTDPVQEPDHHGIKETNP